MFNLNDNQYSELETWKKEQDAKVVELQKDKGDPNRIRPGLLFGMAGKPYYGCSDGGYTYSFTPTTLGTVIKVKNNVTKEEIDLTDYDAW